MFVDAVNAVASVGVPAVVWGDAGWLGLTSWQRFLFMSLLADPNMCRAGFIHVVDVDAVAGRENVSSRVVWDGLEALRGAGWLMVDDTTGEAWVPDLLVWCGLLETEAGGRGLLDVFNRVVSVLLRDACVERVKRLQGSGLPGVAVFLDGVDRVSVDSADTARPGRARPLLADKTRLDTIPTNDMVGASSGRRRLLKPGEFPRATRLTYSPKR